MTSDDQKRLPPSRHGGDPAAVEDEGQPGLTLGSALMRFALGAVLLVVFGLVSGYLFGRGTPQRAAATIVDDFVITEDFQGNDAVAATTTQPAPTSGNHLGSARCGVSGEPVGVDDQLASLAGGIVLVQFRPDDLDDAAVATAESLAANDRRVVVAPNPDLDAPVMATAWARRMPLDGVNRELLSAFVTAYEGSGPAPGPCPGA